MAERTLKLGVDSRGAERGFRRAERASDKFNRSARSSASQTAAVGSAFRKLRNVTLGAGFGAAAMGYAAKQAFDLAAAVEETGNRFDTVFGSATGRVEAFGESFATMAGLSESEFESVIATTGQIAQGMGFAEGASADFAMEITRLAGDLTSFNDIPIESTSRAVQAALTGEREQLKRLGIVLREADVQQRALNISGKESVDALTQQERATATLELITERAGVAVGDLARTQDSAQNRARALDARFDNIKETIATGVMPAIEGLLPVFDQLASKAETFAMKTEEATRALLEMAGLADQDFAIQQAGIEANLQGLSGEGAESFLAARLQVEAQEFQRLEDRVREIQAALFEATPAFERAGRTIEDMTNDAVQELREEMETSGNVMRFISERLANMGQDAAGAVGGVDDLTGSLSAMERIMERMRGAMPLELSFLQGQIDSSIPAPDVTAGPVSRRHPLNFNPAAGPGGGGRHADLAQIDAAVRATAALARASGTLSDEAMAAVSGISDIIGGIQGLGSEGASTADKLLAGGSLLGGLVTFGQALLSLGDDTREAIQEIRNAMADLSFAVDEFAGTATEADRVIRRAVGLTEQLVEGDPRIQLAEGVTYEQAVREGLSFEEAFDLDPLEVGRLGWEGLAEAQEQYRRILEGTAGNIANLGDETDKAAEAMNNVASVLNQPEGFKGVLDLLRFDATDPTAPDFTTDRNIGRDDLGGRDGRGLRTEPLGMRGQEVFQHLAETTDRVADALRRGNEGRTIQVNVDGRKLFEILEDQALSADDRGQLTPLTSRSFIR